MRTASLKMKGAAGRERAGTYLYLPFEVPEWCRAIEVEYSYRGLGPGECTIDIGVFEPGPLELVEAMESFRGWSGSNKKSFYISEASATPSYIPGPLRSGTWHVILGLYKIPEGGCEYEVSITFSEEARGGGGAGGSTLQPVEGGLRAREGWVRGDFHAHTVHSDGDSSISELASTARKLGLDFVAVTDHNTHSHVLEMGGRSLFLDGVLVLRGVEVTTYRGHFNVYGVERTPEFRIQSTADLLRAVEDVRRRGGVVSVNHPKPLGPDWEWGVMGFADLVEVFHAFWEFNNYVSLRKWDDQLRAGHRLGLVGGSDVHNLKVSGDLLLLGTPTTWVYVDELSEEGLLRGLLRQRVFVSESPSGPKVELAVAEGGRVVPMGGTAAAVGNARVLVKVEEGAGHLARLVTDKGVIATWNVEEKAFEAELEVDLRDAIFIRLETLRAAEDPLDPYHPENVLSSLTAPIHVSVGEL